MFFDLDLIFGGLDFDFLVWISCFGLDFWLFDLDLIFWFGWILAFWFGFFLMFGFDFLFWMFDFLVWILLLVFSSSLSYTRCLKGI